MNRLLASLLLVAVTAASAQVLGLPELTHEVWYVPVASGLLAVGLYASTSTISLGSMRRHWRTVLAAVTLGVLLKAAMIGAVMVALFRDPVYLVVAMAVAQIDPLSVAAVEQHSGLTPEGRSLLRAWASFDDPMTVLLAVQLSLVVLALQGRDAVVTGVATGGFAGGLVRSGLFVLAAAGCWLALCAVGRRTKSRGVDVAELVLLLGVVCVSVWQSTLLGLAVVGLFLRPRVLARASGAAAVARVTDLAFYLAVLMLGLVVAGGLKLGVGAVLGLAAYGAQVVAGLLLTRRLPADRLRLSLAQQNGITAILLGLVLEPVFPGSLGVIAPAILVVNLLHFVGWRLLERRGDAGRGRSRSAGPAAGRGRLHRLIGA